MLKKYVYQKERGTMKALIKLPLLHMSYYVKKRGLRDHLSQYKGVLNFDITEEEMANIHYEPQFFCQDEPELSGRYEWIYNLCQGNPVALTAVGLYLLCLMEERTITMLREIFGVEEGLALEVVGRMCQPEYEIFDMVEDLREQLSLLHILLTIKPQPHMLKAPFQLDSRLAGFFAEDDSIDWNLEQFCTLFTEDEPLSPMILMKGELERTKTLLSKDPFAPLVLIRGEGGSGRKFFVKHLVSQVGGQVIFCPISALIQDNKLISAVFVRILRELMLSTRVLCLTGVTQEIPTAVLVEMEEKLMPFQRPLFITCEAKSRLLPTLKGSVISVVIPSATIFQSTQLWDIFAQYLPEKETPFPSGELASKMCLTAGQIRRVTELLALEQNETPWNVKEIFRICYQILDDGTYDNGNFSAPSYTFEDLKLEAPLKNILLEVCAQVEHQELVLDTWGLRKRFPYGRSVSVLFSGPPGTGKTMSAQVLASMLGLELFQIDLSQVVDKYIGETEKRLDKVFEQAEKSNMILFFDEADALFGKRSEISDAKDKYANTEVSFLLQRIEQYSGVVIMATNQASNLDRAFLRRFRYHMIFTLPDENLRRALWEDTLAGIPSQQIDWDYLVNTFPLSGAQIKNIALNAAYGAARDSQLLTMEHLVRAVDEEQRKEGVLMRDFGQYGRYLKN